jgi:hypothetical protein
MRLVGGEYAKLSEAVQETYDSEIMGVSPPAETEGQGESRPADAPLAETDDAEGSGI